jgi:fructuronate reductase
VRLALDTLGQVPPVVRHPAYDPRDVVCGVVHLGVGGFHRAHQAVFLDDAIGAGDRRWGIIGVSMRKPDVADALSGQDGLYTVETLDTQPAWRVIGALRQTRTLPLVPESVMADVAAPTTHLVTLTVTEKGYCLAGEMLDFAHPDIVHDLASPDSPRSAAGVLCAGLARRRAEGAGPLTVISCDNLLDNGPRLRGSVLALADRRDADLARWIADAIAFPDTMVDCIVPASTPDSRARTNAVLGLADHASVQREAYVEWVIENRFAGPVPDWRSLGVILTDDVGTARRLKLHVLNAAHSALAYLGQERGHTLVREAIADPQLAAALDALMRDEIGPALPELTVADYWHRTRARFANPAIDHRLDQIAQDGGFKLSQRLYPLMIANHRAGRPIAGTVSVVQAFLRAHRPADTEALSRLFPAQVWSDPELRRALTPSNLSLQD